MRILMIGWEYPPHISGGLGTACEGLTTALSRLGVHIDFVVPRAWGDEDAAHMTLLGVSPPPAPPPSDAGPGQDEQEPPATGEHDEPAAGPALDDVMPDRTSADAGAHDDAALAAPPPPGQAVDPTARSGTGDAAEDSENENGDAADLPEDIPGDATEDATRGVLRTWRIPAHLSPYLSAADYEALRAAFGVDGPIDAESLPAAGAEIQPGQDVLEHVAASLIAAGLAHVAPRPATKHPTTPAHPTDDGGHHEHHGDPSTPAASGPAGAHYGDDLFGEVARYAAQVSALAAGRRFDLIHAHDWMTWPAAIAVARQSGAPLVAHVHSLEHDRSGAHPDVRIDAVERAGLAAADRVVCVSHYTAGIVREQYGVPADLLRVVHNGVYAPAVVRDYRRSPRTSGQIVLFLGRITFQKGPDYFVEAAARVARHLPDVTFVVAGSGDMVPGLERRVNDLGLADRFSFPGFLRGAEVERMFSLADLYVMPSVSEPFGIAPLEAMSHDTPVIVSKQSGVSEVLSHALKVDFWDVERMADLMLGALRYPELRQEIVDMARDEVRRIHWDAAAEKCLRIYHETVAAAR